MIKKIQYSGDCVAALTLDLENDYGRGDNYQSLEEIEGLTNILVEEKIPVTIFITGKLMKTHPEVIDRFSQVRSEIQLHSYEHNLKNNRRRDREYDLTEIIKSKQVYIKNMGVKPIGYRFPEGIFSNWDYELLKQEGFLYSSSVFPTWFPKRFNNLSKPRNPYYIEEHGIMEIPISVVTPIRIPLSQSYFKVMGLHYFNLLKLIRLPRIIVFDFHIHDLYKTDAFDRLPKDKQFLLGRNYLKSESMFKEFIGLLKERGYSFITVKELYQNMS